MAADKKTALINPYRLPAVRILIRHTFRNHEIPIIAMTAHAMAGDHEDA